MSMMSNVCRNYITAKQKKNKPHKKLNRKVICNLQNDMAKTAICFFYLSSWICARNYIFGPPKYHYS